MKTASRILGTAFFLEGFEVQDAPRYGAERRGAPIFAYVRASRGEIYERGIIRSPDLVVVADETLVPVASAGVLQGVTDRTVLLINSGEDAGTWQGRLGLRGPVLMLPAEAEECAELRFIGASCAGAAARLLGVISGEALAGAVREELGTMSATVIEKNLELALAAYDLFDSYAGLVAEGEVSAVLGYKPPAWVDLPFEEADLSAPDIHAAATSVEVRTGLWRTMRPIIDYDLCNRCAWVCSTFCPDSAIHLTEEGAPEIDYDHCKGCLICVAVCPPHAIRVVPESAAEAKEEATR
jgi:pyruvate ferredoxin oxidoreductase gamma subunit